MFWDIQIFIITLTPRFNEVAIDTSFLFNRFNGFILTSLFSFYLSLNLLAYTPGYSGVIPPALVSLKNSSKKSFIGQILILYFYLKKAQVFFERGARWKSLLSLVYPLYWLLLHFYSVKRTVLAQKMLLILQIRFAGNGEVPAI